MKPGTQSRLFLPVMVLLLAIFVMGTRPARTAGPLWQEINEAQLTAPGPRSVVPLAYRTFLLDVAALERELAAAPLEFTPAADAPLTLALPLPDGTLANFAVVESPFMQPEDMERMPDVKMYAGQGIDDPATLVRFVWSDAGLHAYLRTGSGDALIDVYSSGDRRSYVAYWYEDRPVLPIGPLDDLSDLDPHEHDPLPPASPGARQSSGPEVRLITMAVTTTGEYGQWVGDKSAAEQSIIDLLNDTNLIWEPELGVRFVLALNWRDYVFADPATDPFPTGDEPEGLRAQNQAFLDSVLGTDNYDVGHLLTTIGGGVAALPSACIAGSQAYGRTGFGSLEVFAHEVAHQFGAAHTFNGTQGDCGNDGQYFPNSAFEPGSGVTIQSYAGFCGDHNIATSRILYYHTHSFDQIRNHLDAFPACGTTVFNGNQTPVAVALVGGFTIPMDTPFELTGAGNDPDGDPLTYSWEQMDLGPAGDPNNPSGNAPLFRSFAPVDTPTRTFPNLPDLLAGTVGPGELLPTYARSLTFRLTVRDNRQPSGGVSYDTISFDVTDQAGPFRLTSFNDPDTVALSGSTVNVTWDPAGTQAAPVSCSNVSIRLSSNGGLTFSAVLASVTPNDGSELVQLPFYSTDSARLRIECVGNVFFDVNDSEFTIRPPVAGINGAACAFPSLSGALAAANSGDSVYLMPGTYEEPFAVVARDITITQGASNCNSKGSGGNVIIDARQLGRVAFVEDSTLTLENVTLTGGDNEVEGGGIFAVNSSIIMASAVITDSKAVKGGGIYLANSDLTMRGSSVVGNGSASEGGTVYADVASTILMEDSARLFDGYATSGGNLFADGTVTLRDSSAVESGYAFASGGGIYMNGGTLSIAGTARIDDNYSGNYGGGIYARAVYSVTLSENAQVTNNRALLGGGGALFDEANGAALIEGNVQIAGNDSQQSGGGLAFTDGAAGVIRGSTWVHGNYATRNGGGIYVNENATVTIAENVVLGGGRPVYANTTGPSAFSSRNGGGAAAVHGAGSTLTLRDSARIFNNRASYGGGLRAAAGAQLVLSGGVLVDNNTADDLGGGIFVADTDTLLTMGSGTRLSANVAGSGGGLVVYSGGVAQLNNVTIDGNSAGSGAGLYAVAGAVSLSGGSISGNTASAQGGGVHASTNLTVTHTIVDGNSASDGGGMFLRNNWTMRLDGIQVTNNSATDGAGLYFNQTSDVTMLGPWLEDNVAGDEGGAIYATGTVNASIQGGNILTNQAALGGGIFATTDAHMVASDVRLVGNHATSQGGGVWLDRSASVTLRSAFSDGGAALCPPDVKPADNYCMELRENSAGSTGGGAYAASATLDIAHTAIISNSAPAAPGVLFSGATTGGLRHSLVTGHGGDWSVDVTTGADINVDFATIAGNDRGIRFENIGSAMHGTIIWNNGLAGIDLLDTDNPLSATCNNTQDVVLIGADNISADPLFTTTARGMYRLDPASPSINACATGSGPDLDNRPRPGAAAYDMGAFESLFAQVFVVDDPGTTGDAAPGDGACDAGAGRCTLRAALEEANARPVRDVVELGTVTINETGLQIDYPVEIRGAGPQSSVVDGQLAGPLFVINATQGETIIRDVALRGGSGGTGGAVSNFSDLTLINVEISGSRATQGGAIGQQGLGALTVINSALHGNQAFGGGGGGALYHGGSGPVSLTNVTVSGNSATSSGGGIAHAGSGALTATNVTISDNSSNGDGGGIYRAFSAGSFTLQNSIVSGNRNNFNDAPECAGFFQVPGGLAAIGQLTGLCNFSHAPYHVGLVSLGPLQDNGGGTLTHAILEGDVVHDTGSNAVCPQTDQRGLLRDTQCDVGAFEVNGTPTQIGLGEVAAGVHGGPARLVAALLGILTAASGVALWAPSWRAPTPSIRRRFRRGFAVAICKRRPPPPRFDYVA